MIYVDDSLVMYSSTKDNQFVDLYMTTNKPLYSDVFFATLALFCTNLQYFMRKIDHFDLL